MVRVVCVHTMCILSEVFVTRYGGEEWKGRVGD